MVNKRGERQGFSSNRRDQSPAHSKRQHPWSVHQASVLAAFGCMLGCVCPPCAVAPSEVAGGTHEILWDGEGTHSGAKGWADCDQKTTGCEATVESIPALGRDGTTGLSFGVKGQGWFGVGWNLFGWWPTTAGVDITPYNTLTFAMRVEARAPDQAPDLSALTAGMRCSKGPKNTASVNIEPYAQGATDGKWHVVEMPLAEFYKGEGAEFDPGSAWEFDFSAYTPTQRQFTIFLDDISVVKR